MNQINSVCVYSASSTKIDAVYFQAAETLGRLFAEHHIRLINGAGSIGLMCSVADAVLKNGGEVTGVIPRFMVEQNWHHTGLTELIEKDRVLGLRLGADDYITKPFAAEELVARMESVLRRTGRGGRELRAYDVVLDTVDRVARQNGEPLDLRRREFDLLELLMRNRGAALYRDVIFERVWGELPDTESLRTVDTHIARLRKKLGWTDKQIETVFKIGYRLRKE